MNKSIKLLSLAVVISSAIISSAQANSASVSGNILYTTQNGQWGTTYDKWNINMLNSGSFKVNVLAFESTSNSADDAIDINGDGEFTYLDPDTYFYKNTGNPLVAADFLARCDDINNNCGPIDTATIKLNSLSEAEGALDGSIHHRRDPAFDITLTAGEYFYLMADYRLSTSDAEDGFDFGNTIRNLPNEIEGHADYLITFSSDSMHFDVSGNSITVSAVPIPATFWLFGSALFGLMASKKAS